MFPFAEPHYFAPLREVWLEQFRLDPKHEFKRLSQIIGEDRSVWLQLAAYVERHREAFEPA